MNKINTPGYGVANRGYSHKIKTPDIREDSSSSYGSDRVNIGSDEEKVASAYSGDAKDPLQDKMEFLHVGSEIANAAEATGLLSALGTMCGAVSGIFFGIEGYHDMKTAVREKNLGEGIEAAGHLALAAEAAVDVTTAVSSTSVASGLFGPVAKVVAGSSILGLLGTTFGVAHGAAEVITGGRGIYHGIKQGDKKKILEGAFDVGMGAAVGAIALGGGLPAGIALGAIFITRLVTGRHRQKKNTTLKAVKYTGNKLKSMMSRSSKNIRDASGKPGS